ncbi:MAG TPA: MBL fold metallo-hydrolase [Thermoanaerobaculia bacterium]|nr:MBL fold metallo-hydrolase [Thermoanaerobaculia bacterium]
MRDAAPRYGEVERLSPRVRRVVQRNPGLFTGPGTNTYLIGPEDRSAVAVLDPGQEDDEHLAALCDAIGDTPVRAVLVSHAHPDHWPLAPTLAERFGAPVLAYAATGEFRPHRALADGEVIDLGDVALRAVHTPGHARDHLCFLMERERALFSGDHVMGWSTSVIAPPDGDLRQFLSALERLLELDQSAQLAVLYPGHGPTVAQPRQRMTELRDHRLRRTEQALAALRERPGTPAELVERIYTDVDPKLHGAARMSLLAHLLALVEEGRAAPRGADPATATYELRS